MERKEKEVQERQDRSRSASSDGSNAAQMGIEALQVQLFAKGLS